MPPCVTEHYEADEQTDGGVPRVLSHTARHRQRGSNTCRDCRLLFGCSQRRGSAWEPVCPADSPGGGADSGYLLPAPLLALSPSLHPVSPQHPHWVCGSFFIAGLAVYMYTFFLGKVTAWVCCVALPCLFVWPCLLLSFFLLISHLKTCIRTCTYACNRYERWEGRKEETSKVKHNKAKQHSTPKTDVHVTLVYKCMCLICICTNTYIYMYRCII